MERAVNILNATDLSHLVDSLDLSISLDETVTIFQREEASRLSRNSPIGI